MSSFFWMLSAFILALSPLIFFHELGHYLVARACGVKVESFSIGFGPQLIGWTDKAGTHWKISLFLMGGYVQMLGDANVASSAPSKTPVIDKSQTLYGKSPWQRILIALAGPIANYLLAFILLLTLFTTVGEPIYQPIFGTIQVNSIARKSGLQKGDRILSAQSQPITTFTDFIKILEQTPAKTELPLSIQRQNKMISVVVPPLDKEGMWLGKLGVSPDSTPLYTPLSFCKANHEIWNMMNPVKMIRLINLDNMSGPIGIAQHSGDILKSGWIPMLFFMAMISIALGFFNLLPFPLLDGGLVFFSLIEIIFRRPLSVRIQHIISVISLVILGGFFIFVSWKDLQKIPIVVHFLKNLGLMH